MATKVSERVRKWASSKGFGAQRFANGFSGGGSSNFNPDANMPF